MIGHCRDCRWWLPSPTRQTGRCDLAHSEHEQSTHETKAVARDREGCEAWLFTDYDFGCVQFEAKP